MKKPDIFKDMYDEFISSVDGSFPPWPSITVNNSIKFLLDNEKQLVDFIEKTASIPSMYMDCDMYHDDIFYHGLITLHRAHDENGIKYIYIYINDDGIVASIDFRHMASFEAKNKYINDHDAEFVSKGYERNVAASYSDPVVQYFNYNIKTLDEIFWWDICSPD